MKTQKELEKILENFEKKHKHSEVNKGAIGGLILYLHVHH